MAIEVSTLFQPIFKMEESESNMADELSVSQDDEACASGGNQVLQEPTSARSLAQMETSTNYDIMMISKRSAGSNRSKIQRSQSLPYLPTPPNKGLKPHLEQYKFVNTEAALTPDSIERSSIASTFPTLSVVGSINSSNRAEDSTGLQMNLAMNRLRTFQKFWSRKNEFTNMRLLVAYGFYCIGQGDAVECFHCHIVIANWIRNDDPRERHVEISPHCEFINGQGCGDVPLTSQSRRNRERRSMTTTDLPGRVSPTHSPRNSERPASSTQRPERYATITETERCNLLQTFPCANPANPSMRQEQARLQNLNNSSFRIYTRLRASNETVAKAGLYYDNEGDKTKCWFCDGGLKDYDEDDDPWVEHAKYYPECEFLAQQRGLEWVREISMQNPNIQRPILPTREAEVLPQSQEYSSIESQDIVDISLTRQTRQAILNEAMQSNPSRSAIDMGFEEELVKNAQIRKIMQTGSSFETCEELVDVLTRNINVGEPESAEQNTGTRNVIDMSGRTVHIRGGNFSGRSIINGVLHNNPFLHGVEDFTDVTYVNPNQRHVFNNIGRNIVTSTPNWNSSTRITTLPENGDEAIGMLRNERGCKICYANLADILFLPCRHICACAPCSRRLTCCPICRNTIIRSIQAYRS